MNLHVRSEISAVRGVAQQEQVLVAYGADRTVRNNLKSLRIVIYHVCAGISAVVGVEPILVGVLAEIYGNRAGKIARQRNLPDGNSFIISSVVVVVHGEAQARHDVAEIEAHVPRGAQVVIDNGDHRIGRFRVVQFVAHIAVCTERHGERQLRHTSLTGRSRTLHREVILRVVSEEGVPIIIGSCSFGVVRRVIPFTRAVIVIIISAGCAIVGDSLFIEHVGKGVASLVTPNRTT